MSSESVSTINGNEQGTSSGSDLWHNVAEVCFDTTPVPLDEATRADRDHLSARIRSYRYSDYAHDFVGVMIDELDAGNKFAAHALRQLVRTIDEDDLFSALMRGK